MGESFGEGCDGDFILWCILLVVCWPLVLVLLPFRIVGIAVGGVLDLIRAIILLPARALRGPRSATAR